MTPTHWTLLAVCAPVAGFVVPSLALRGRIMATAWWTVACGVVSFVAALGLLFTLPAEAEAVRYEWLTSGEFTLQFGFLLDGLSAISALVVSLITLCVMVYSIGYMAGDPGRCRYFSLLAFFEWTMLCFVLSVNLMQTFVFWELVGVASFFLIGFWFEKPSAMAAARKAFLMTRIGDVGLFIGMIMLLQGAGTYDLPAVLDAQTGAAAAMAPSALTLAMLLVFAGVAGKSAQFPLHTWLPDAMEGPTPVSALLHSATMVAAGVLLLARLHPLLEASPAAATTVLWIATLTALLSATVAMVVRDIKRVLAYSSIGQLSFMLMGLAGGSVFAGVFHLATHAAFKALLFLCAGAYIHHYATNDMVAIGRRMKRGGAREVRMATIGLVVGATALAGLPPLSGFFSKEHIFGALHASHRNGFAIAALIAAFLTAYYTFRMVFLVTRGNSGSALADPDEEPEAHGGHDEHHTPAWVMGGPIALLAFVAAVAGLGAAGVAALLDVELEPFHLVPTLVAVGVAAAGVAAAWMDFGRAGASQAGFVARFPALGRLFANGWYIDRFYDGIIGAATWAVARVCYFVETRGLDGSADRMGRGVVDGGRATAAFQAGRLQIYVGITLIFIIVFVGYVGLG